jgi:Tol biopolymer transport system component
VSDMRTIAGVAAFGAALHLSVAEPSSVQTVAQSDARRSYLEAPAAAVSADGRFIAFVSYARLAPADTNDERDIYVLDRADSSVTLESLTGDNRTSFASSLHPALSGDGRFLVYETGGEIALRDRHEGTTTILGPGMTPAISRDGRAVVFASPASTLVADSDANGAGYDVYLVEVESRAIRRISLSSSGIQPAIGSSMAPSVSADGRYVAFASSAPLESSQRSEGPAVGDRSRQRAISQIYVRDTLLNVTRRVSVCARGELPDADSWGPVISADGRSVAFVSAATNFSTGDRNRSSDVFLADLKTGAIELVSRSAGGGSGNGASAIPALSSDGRFVAFQSEASDLLCAGRCPSQNEDINLLWDVFLLDREKRLMIRVSADTAGGWMEGSGGPALDASASTVVFSSRHPISRADMRNDFDLFVLRR